MISFSNDSGGYAVKISHPGTGTRGKKFHARNVTELHESIDHYYAHGGHHVNGLRETCPLCRDTAKERKGK